MTFAMSNETIPALKLKDERLVCVILSLWGGVWSLSPRLPCLRNYRCGEQNLQNFSTSAALPEVKKPVKSKILMTKFYYRYWINWCAVWGQGLPYNIWKYSEPWVGVLSGSLSWTLGPFDWSIMQFTDYVIDHKRIQNFPRSFEMDESLIFT